MIPSMKLISLGGRGGNHVALVDDDDYPELIKLNWWAAKTRGEIVYAMSKINVNGRRVPIWMHRIVLKPGRRYRVDHWDGNGLNNQKKNLRRANFSQNQANSRRPKNNKSGFKGVCWNKRLGKWIAQIGVRRRVTHIGVFEDKKDAARAYDQAAEKAFGRFSLTNKKLGLL